MADASSDSRIFKIAPNAKAMVLAGASDGLPGYADGTGSAARFNMPQGVTVGANGVVYVADTVNNAIRGISPAGKSSTLAGAFCGAELRNGPRTTASFNQPFAMCWDLQGNLIVADSINQALRKIDRLGRVTTLAVLPGWTYGIATDPQGRILVACPQGPIFRVDSNGASMLLAGAVHQIGAADGMGTAARFSVACGLAVDSDGIAYVADSHNHAIRKVAPDGQVTTLAGRLGVSGWADGQGASARFQFPKGLALDGNHTLIVADAGNHVLRRVTLGGQVTTIAGRVGVDQSLDGDANAARVYAPHGVAVEPSGAILFTEWDLDHNSTVRRLGLDGRIATLGGKAGTFGAMDGTGGDSRFYAPTGVIADSAGRIYVADIYDNVIRISLPAATDTPTLDPPSCGVGETVQLGVADASDAQWSWRLVRRPSSSQAELSSTQGPNPVFVPDVPDLFVFQLAATNRLGQYSLRTVELWSTNRAAQLNRPPVLASIPEVTGDEGALLSFVATASDPDAGQTVRFELAPGAPAGASMDSSTGRFRWTPSEAQGPGIYSIGVIARDNGSPSLSATQQARAVVREVNAPPVLAAVGPVNLASGESLALRLSAADPDLPPQILRYRLLPDSPTNATLDAASGLLEWTPNATQGPGEYLFTVSVGDDGVPSREASSKFRVSVAAEPPRLARQPADLDVPLGAAVAFEVEASGASPLRYQWFKDGELIPGATGTACRFLLAQPADAGTYWVIVSDDWGAETSRHARLTVQEPVRRATVLTGQVTDAVNGAPVEGVRVSLGEGQATTSAGGWYGIPDAMAGSLRVDFAASHRPGAVPLSVAFDNQTAFDQSVVLAAREGYQNYTNARLTLVPGVTNRLDLSLSPANLTGLRLVLNWGDRPRDLDAHLLVPAIENREYEVAYPASQRGSLTQAPYAFLDVDRTDGFGPETVTIAQLQPGTYGYFVQNYREEQGDTGRFPESGATVQVYGDQGLLLTIPVPTAGDGEFWDVCAIDGVTGTIAVRGLLSSSRPTRETYAADPGTPPPAAPPESPVSGYNRYFWDFGDGTGSTNESPSHLYVAPGSYDVRLLAIAGDGRWSLRTRPAWVVVGDEGWARPRLSITVAGSQIVLGWEDARFRLLAKTNLAEAVWSAIASAPPPVGATNRVALPMVEATRYFQLEGP